MEPGEPDCPSWLKGDSRVIWGRLVRDLVDRGIITPLDGAAFARYCVYVSLWLKELSNPLRTEATLERYANQLNRLESSFGLTPSSRRSLKVEHDGVEDDDPLDALLRRRQQRVGDADSKVKQ